MRQGACGSRDELDAHIERILKGGIRGRVVVDVCRSPGLSPRENRDQGGSHSDPCFL